jgi:hypothetical protein
LRASLKSAFFRKRLLTDDALQSPLLFGTAPPHVIRVKFACFAEFSGYRFGSLVERGVIRLQTAGRSLSRVSWFNDPASPIGHVDGDTPLFELASSDEFGTEWSKRTLAG